MKKIVGLFIFICVFISLVLITDSRISSNYALAEGGETPVIFFTALSGSITNYFPSAGVSVETSATSLMCYVPETGASKQVDWASSASYAVNIFRVYKANDYIYSLQLWDPYEWDSNRMDVIKYDPITLEQISSDTIWAGGLEGGITIDNFAIVGDKAYYKTKRGNDLWEPLKGGELYVYNLATDIKTKLLEYDDSDNYGTLYSDHGDLYAIDYYKASGRLYIYRKNLQTGKNDSVLANYILPRPLNYLEFVYFAIDNGDVYYSRVNSSDYTLEIRKAITDEVVFSQIIRAPTVDLNTAKYGYEIDADKGHILIYDRHQWDLCILDIADNTLTTVTNASANRARILLEANPNIQSGSDTDNDGDGYTENQGDCNDSAAAIYPGASEICGDGIDQDCNGSDLSCDDDSGDDVDDDGDGYTENQGDTNDNDASIYPESNDDGGGGGGGGGCFINALRN